MATRKVLTEQQQKFIEVLFTEAAGDPVKARKLAGYAEGSSTKVIMTALKEEVIEATQLFMAMNAPRAAMAVISGITDPTELGMRDKLNAAKDLLDRAGHRAVDVVEHRHSMEGQLTIKVIKEVKTPAKMPSITIDAEGIVQDV